MITFTVPSVIEFQEPYVECEQSEGTLTIPVVRSQGQTGKIVLPWRIASAPGKPRSRYEGMNDTITFKDGEAEQGMLHIISLLLRLRVATLLVTPGLGCITFV